MPNTITLYYTIAYPRPASGILTGTAPGGGDIVGDYRTFNPLRMLDFELQTNENSGRMHGGMLYSNVLDSRYSHSIYLQPKQLTPTNIEFIEKFWKADFKYIQFPLAGAGRNNVRQVTTAGNKLPLTRINDMKFLKELTLELTEVLPNAN